MTDKPQVHITEIYFVNDRGGIATVEFDRWIAPGDTISLKVEEIIDKPRKENHMPRKLKFQIYCDKKGEYRWRLLSSNGKILADSGEGYKRAGAMKGSLNAFITAIQEGRFVVKDMQK